MPSIAHFTFSSFLHFTFIDWGSSLPFFLITFILFTLLEIRDSYPNIPLITLIILTWIFN